MLDETGILPHPISIDTNTYRLNTLMHTFERRKPFFEQVWRDKVLPGLNRYPQTEEGEVNYLLCGSGVYCALVVAGKTEEVVGGGQIQRKLIQVSPLTKAGLSVPLLIPWDVDTIRLRKEYDLGLPFDKSPDTIDLFWQNMPGGIRTVVHEVMGQEVYTVHPVDNLAFRIIAHFLPFTGDHALNRIPRKLDQILRSLYETWPEGEIRKRAIEAITSIDPFHEAYNKWIQTDPISTLWGINQPRQFKPVNAEDFLPDVYTPLIIARKNGAADKFPTLTAFLESLTS